jgi:hypothetical protein
MLWERAMPAIAVDFMNLKKIAGMARSYTMR